MRTDLTTCRSDTLATKLQSDLRRHQGALDLAKSDEQIALDRLARTHEDVEDAAARTAHHLGQIDDGPAGTPLRIPAGSSAAVNAIRTVIDEMENAARRDATTADLDKLRTLIADNDLDPAFCAALFYGTDAGANTYLALAAAGRSGDQEFVDQLVHAAAIAGITRGELMTKVAYHQMQSWRHSNTATVIKGSMPPGGVPSNRGLIGSTMTGYGLLGLQFRPGRPWDAKPELDNMLLAPGDTHVESLFVSIADELELHYDTFGNIQYGYMMAEFGITEAISIQASHGIPGVDDMTSDLTGVTDNGDDIAILLGYRLHETYPADITLEQFEEFMQSDFAIEQLRRGMKIQAVGDDQ